MEMWPIAAVTAVSSQHKKYPEEVGFMTARVHILLPPFNS